MDEIKSKNSRQNDLILRILRSTRCHPNASWIFVQARKEIPNISLGTVYRNLKNLIRKGKIQELSIGNGLTLYDGDLRNHDHIQCMVCSKVDDVPHIFHSVAFGQVEEATGYEVVSRRIEFFGTCPECVKKSVAV
jgi:Fur family peroxide stress response transcriptional regulator